MTVRNPTYAGDAQPKQLEAIQAMDFTLEVELPMLRVCIKTMTHNRAGLKLHPHDVVVIEISCGEELGSMDLDTTNARRIARRMLEFADKIDAAAAAGRN